MIDAREHDINIIRPSHWFIHFRVVLQYVMQMCIISSASTRAAVALAFVMMSNT